MLNRFMVLMFVLGTFVFGGCASAEPNGRGSSIRWGPKILNRYPGTYLDTWRVGGSLPKVVRYVDSGEPTNRAEFNRDVAVDAAGYVWRGRTIYTITANVCDEKTGEVIQIAEFEVRLVKSPRYASGLGVSPENDISFVVTENHVECNDTYGARGSGRMRRIAPLAHDRIQPLPAYRYGDRPGDSPSTRPADGRFQGPQEIYRTPEGGTRVRW